MDREELMATLEDNECLVADGLEDALIGFVEGAGIAMKAVYDRNKCIEKFMADGSDRRRSGGMVWIQRYRSVRR